MIQPKKAPQIDFSEIDLNYEEKPEWPETNLSPSKNTTKINDSSNTITSEEGLINYVKQVQNQVQVFLTSISLYKAEQISLAPEYPGRF